MSEKRIVFTNPDGSIGVVIPAPGITVARAKKDIPEDASNVTVVDASALPSDRLFRAAWTLEGASCVECPVKSKQVAHEIRRAKRAAEFAPHDEVIAKRLPGEDVAEAARADIRAKYEAMQNDIDSSATVADLRVVLGA